MALGDQAAVSGTNFLTGLLVGRACAPEVFGRYVMALSLVLLLSEMHHALISTPHTIFSPRYQGSRLAEFNGSTLGQCLILGGLCALGLIAAAVLLPERTQDLEALGSVLLALAVSIWAIFARNYARLFSFAIHRPRVALAVDAAVMLLQLGSVGLLAWNDALNSQRAILLIGGANAAAALAWFIPSRRRFSIDVGRSLSTIRQTWPLARWVFFSGLLWTLSIHAYPWVISFILGHDGVGIWGACFAIAAVANPLLMGLQNLVAPSIAHAFTRRDTVGFRRHVLRLAVGFAGLMIPFAIPAALLAEWFVRLYGEVYAGNGHIVTILAASTIIQGFSFSLSRGLFAAHQARHDLIANVVSLGVLLLVGYPLISRFGVAGAAGCLVASEVLGALYRLGSFLISTRDPMDEPARRVEIASETAPVKMPSLTGEAA